MSNKELYSNLAGFIMALWWILHITSFNDMYKMIPSHLLFRKCKYSDVNKISSYIFLKIYEEKDSEFITKLKVKLNTYIDFYKHNNKNLLNNIVTIIITSVVTVTVTQYTLQGQTNQTNKEFITQIIDRLNDEYMFIFYWIIIIYGIIGVSNVFKNIKFEYYLMIKNIIDEVEKNKPVEQNDAIKREYYTSFIKKYDIIEIN